MNAPRRSLLLVLSLALASAALLVGCGGTAAPSATASPQEVSLQLNWFHEAEFVGYYVADAKGFYAANGLRVDIREGGPGDPAVDHVLDGTADFAVSSFGEHKDLIAANRPLQAVMAGFQIPPLVIFSLSEAGIREPSDLVGKRVGITTDYWGDVLRETLKAAGVDPRRVKVVSVQVEDLQALYDKRVDAWLGYAQDEPIKAQMTGRAVTNIFPADYGVGGYEGLILTPQTMIEDDPEVVRGFVRASQQGWRYAVEHPDEAAQILLEWAPDLGLEFQKAAVRAVSPLVDIPQVPIGWIDAQRWRRLMGAAYAPDRPGYTMSFSASER